ncbi:MAG: Wzz/FepE/Etk N-terminal domain-containing protein [Meiothermus sp.]|uniref:Wzz/FepE/Etk N-terminal domain-containing protein n=1 Tax=Meiothermus sp. TaxID=1955249 RepID=UPI00298F3257|nr:Wzz/FepE/Etk N-terminal domain-containing protein [Meiothermus sp.]MDW8425179.1 Wzz/FepE/Etk N-terminal domain-containing protein [Meiothermus sp.]
MIQPIPQEPEIDLVRLGQLLRRHGWTLLIFAGSLGLFTLLISFLQTPVYQASSRLLATQSNAFSGSNLLGTVPSQTLLDAEAYREAALSGLVLGRTLQTAGLPSEPADLEQFNRNARVRTIEGQNSNVIILSVRSADPKRAAELANTWASSLMRWDDERVRGSFGSYRESLEAQLAVVNNQINQATNRSPENLTGLRTLQASLQRDIDLVRALERSASGQLSLIDQAIAPARPTSPRPLLYAVAAFLVGLVLAFGLLLLREASVRTVRNADEAFRLTSLPLLGEFPEMPAGNGRTLSPEVAGYLDINVTHTIADSPRIIAITSPVAQEGKSSVAISLARACAKAGKRTLLIDLNSRKPVLHKEFRLAQGEDIVSTLVNLPRVHPQPVMVENNLYVIPCLQPLENPPRLLSELFRPFITHLKESGPYDMIIIDTPPVLSVTDTLIMAPYVSGVLMVVREGQTDRRQLRSALEILKRVGAQTLGLVMNRVRESQTLPKPDRVYEGGTKSTGIFRPSAEEKI